MSKSIQSKHMCSDVTIQTREVGEGEREREKCKWESKISRQDKEGKRERDRQIDRQIKREGREQAQEKDINSEQENEKNRKKKNKKHSEIADTSTSVTLDLEL